MNGYEKYNLPAGSCTDIYMFSRGLRIEGIIKTYGESVCEDPKSNGEGSNMGQNGK